jgi:hypothetical protein
MRRLAGGTIQIGRGSNEMDNIELWKACRTNAASNRLDDPNWFFWAHRKRIFCDRLAIEAKILAARATHIRISKPHRKRWQVEYRWDRDGRFLGFGFVKAKGPFYYPLFNRLPHLNLAYIRRESVHDIRDCRQLIRDFRCLYFEGVNLTKGRCEEFFEYELNFTKMGRGSMLS